jgi:hypothetical protein
LAGFGAPIEDETDEMDEDREDRDELSETIDSGDELNEQVDCARDDRLYKEFELIGAGEEANENESPVSAL